MCIRDSLGEALGGIHDEDIAAFSLLPEHEDDGLDAGAEEDILWQANYGFEVVVFDEVLADCTFFTASEQDLSLIHI